MDEQQLPMATRISVLAVRAWHVLGTARLDRCAGLPWHDVPVLDRTRDRAHGRVELRTLKAVTVNHFGFPHAAPVVQVTRKTRDLGTRRWRTVVASAVTSLTYAQASPTLLADLIRGHGRSRTP
jgi:hypothetical protein